MREYLIAEWQDRWIGYLLATVFYVTFFILAAVQHWKVDMFYTNSAIVFWISTGVMGSAADKEKRDRLYSLIPMPRRDYSIARVVDLVVTKFYLLLFWFVFLVARPEGITADKFWYMLSFSTIAMTIVLCFELYRDLGHFQTWRYRIVFLGIMFVAVTILIFGGFHGEPMGLEIGHDSMTNNPFAFLVYATLFTVLALTSIGVFRRRRSFVT